MGYLQGAREIYIVEISTRVKSSVIRMANAPAMTEISEAEFRKAISKPLVKVGNFVECVKQAERNSETWGRFLLSERGACSSREKISRLALFQGSPMFASLVVGEHENQRLGLLHREHVQHPSTSICAALRLIMLTGDAHPSEAHGARVAGEICTVLHRSRQGWVLS